MEFCGIQFYSWEIRFHMVFSSKQFCLTTENFNNHKTIFSSVTITKIIWLLSHCNVSGSGEGRWIQCQSFYLEKQNTCSQSIIWLIISSFWLDFTHIVDSKNQWFRAMFEVRILNAFKPRDFKSRWQNFKSKLIVAFQFWLYQPKM